jgi:NADPH:quinone reductase-like Zn-dependent oxidoreductase
MRKLVVFGGGSEPNSHPRAEALTMDGAAVRFGFLEDDPPEFDRTDPKNSHAVLTRVKAFSLNYRDKNRIFKTSCQAPADKYYALGSEFAGEVMAVGPQVTRFAVGDRVMGNNAYPDSGGDGVLPGVPTNHASKELQVLHELKLAKIPLNMPDEEAAAFSIGAQTTYSMVRRLSIHAGASVLITAAKSNTSLFAISALRRRNACVYATSSNASFEVELKELGVKGLAVVNHSDDFHSHPMLANIVAQGGFDFVIDPYFDLHFGRALDVMKTGAKYTSCGVYDQYLDLIGKAQPAIRRSGNDFIKVMMKNISVIGNCIGLEDDLSEASKDYAAGSLRVVLDSVFSAGEAAPFLERTYNARDRFGKVVYRYD